jgi:hypothetical protein
MGAANRDAEQALIDYLMERQSLDRPTAIERIRLGIAHGWFSAAEPELRALVVRYRNSLGRGMEGSADSRAARSGLI